MDYYGNFTVRIRLYCEQKTISMCTEVCGTMNDSYVVLIVTFSKESIKWFWLGIIQTRGLPLKRKVGKDLSPSHFPKLLYLLLLRACTFGSS